MDLDLSEIFLEYEKMAAEADALAGLLAGTFHERRAQAAAEAAAAVVEASPSSSAVR